MGALGSEAQHLVEPTDSIPSFLAASFASHAAVAYAVLRLAPPLARMLVGAASTVPLSKAELRKVETYYGEKGGKKKKN